MDPIATRRRLLVGLALVGLIAMGMGVGAFIYATWRGPQPPRAGAPGLGAGAAEGPDAAGEPADMMVVRDVVRVGETGEAAVEPEPGTASGPDGFEKKFGLKQPRRPVPEGVPPPRPRVSERKPAGTAGAMGLPSIRFDEDCEEYGGHVDFSAGPARLDVYLGPGEVCLDMRRPSVYVPEGRTNLYLVGGRELNACDLDPLVRVCLELPDAMVGGWLGSGLWNCYDDPLGTNAPLSAEALHRWHGRGGAPGAGQEAREPGYGPAGSGTGAAEPPAGEAVLDRGPATGWFLDLPTETRGVYYDVYPGVDVACYAEQNRMEYVFTVWPGADPSGIRFHFAGTESMNLLESGRVEHEFECGKLVQHPPLAVRLEDGFPQPVDARFILDDDNLRFSLPSRLDTDETERQGPVLDLSSAWGGSGIDRATAVALDGRGFAYLAGETVSEDFADRRRRSRGGIDVFVTKIRLSDGVPVYTVWFGGSADDRPFGVAADGRGQVWVCGETRSPDLAGAAAPGAAGWNAFVVRLDPDGTLSDTAWLPRGRGDDRAYGIAVDAETNVWVTGETASGDFPVSESQPAERAPAPEDTDVFVARLDGRTLAPVRVTLLGGAGHDSGRAIVVDALGQPCVAGETASRDFPVVHPVQERHGGGEWDAFVVCLDRTGREPRFASFLGGRNDDRAHGISVDPARNLYVVGETSSGDLAVTNAVQSAFAGGDWDGFAAKIAAGPWRPVYLTYIGGGADDRLFSVAAELNGRATFAGSTVSTNLALVTPVQTEHAGGEWDALVGRIEPGGERLSFSTYLGGDREDAGYGVAVDPLGRAYLAGVTASENYPAVDPMQSGHRGDTDAAFGRLLPEHRPGPDLRLVPGGQQPCGPDYDFYMSRFEITNDEFVRFLNDAEINQGNARGTNLYFDAAGSVWFHPDMRAERDEVFTVHDARIGYLQTAPAGARYYVSPAVPPDGGSYSNHPVVGVSWYGAVKYCNWLTIDTGRTPAQRCYREGTNTLDWAPVTCSATNWARGVFSDRERADWLKLKGFRLPMDNCSRPTSWINTFFRVSNAEFAAFLNEVEARPGSLVGTNVYVDAIGNAWCHPDMTGPSRQMFDITVSRLSYDAAARPGGRYRVIRAGAGDRPERRPVDGVSWTGAMKFCNWLTLREPLDAGERAYAEGPELLDWRPVTAAPRPWADGEFSAAARLAWEKVKGYRLPLERVREEESRPTVGPADFPGTNSWPNPFNEFYKAGAWTGATNMPYGFGRDRFSRRDANYLDHGGLMKHDTTPVGFYDGSDHDGLLQTSPNENPYDIYDLSGNVTEWLSDPGRSGSPADRACYGGSWMFALTPLARRFYVHPYFTDAFRGFRVVTTASAEDMYLIRVPYLVCLCGAGSGPGCGPGREAEGGILNDREEDELEGTIETVPRDDYPEFITRPKVPEIPEIPEVPEVPVSPF